MTHCRVLNRTDRGDASTSLGWIFSAGLNRGRFIPAEVSVWLTERPDPPVTYFICDLDATEAQTRPFRERMERVRSELERLRDGWAGEHAKAPSDQTLSDIDQVLEAISSAKAVPEVEVDEDEGHVTFRWQKADMPIALSFVMRGKGQVTIVVTELGDVPRASSQQFSVSNDSAIVRFLNRDEKLMDLLGYA